MGTPSDEELAALAVAARDTRAFGELVKRHQGIVRNMLARMTGNRALADDLAQDAFIRAFEKIASFTGEGSFRGWLCRIAYREFLMSRRKRQAAERALARIKAGDDGSQPVTVDWERGDAVDIDRALKLLTEPERTCVVLCYACGMSHSEAAEATGMPLGTVKSHVFRGRDKMRTAMAVPAEA